MIGMMQERASPHVAVLCKEKWFRTQARHIILEAGFLQDRGWVGCIKLPCEIRQNGETSPTPKSSVKIGVLQKSTFSRRNQHNVAISNLPRSTRIPCGLRIAISGMNGYVRMATLGGIIEINEALFGLSVSHAFSIQTASYYDTTSERDSDTESLVLDQDDLDPFVRTTNSGEQTDVVKEFPDIPAAPESSDEPIHASEAEDVGSSPRSDNYIVEPFMGQRSESELFRWYVLFETVPCSRESLPPGKSAC